MSETQQSFEYYRDNFFVDPRHPQKSHMPEIAGAMARGILDSSDLDGGVPEGPVTDFARELVADYQAARNFDHLSVAQIHPADNIPATLAHFASTIRNNNTIIGEVSPVETSYEMESVQWMAANVAGYDSAEASGSLGTGGTNANYTAMAVAREQLQQDGWQGVAPVKIFASSMAHYSIKKAANLLAPRGIIEVDKVPLRPGDYRMDPDALQERIAQANSENKRTMAIVGIAGETETGLVEDLDDIAEIAEANSAYFHVDGAYGAPFKLSRVGFLFDAVKRANSLTIDPHKYLYTPYPGGAVIFKDARQHALLKAYNEDGANYMFKEDKEVKNFIDSTYLGQKRLEGSMGGQSAATLHAVIRCFGETGIGALLDHNLDMTQLFAEKMIGFKELKPAHEPQLNTLCLEPTEEIRASYPNIDHKLEKVSRELEDRYGIYLSTTSLPDRTEGSDKHHKVFRFVSTHPHTDENSIEFVANSLKKTWKEIDD